jgi:hypothetical protein
MMSRMLGTVALAVLMMGCGDEATEEPPPLTSSPSSTSLPSSEAGTGDGSSTTGEPEVCPWSGQCSVLILVSECGDDWAVACVEGFRCVDTEAEAGVVCTYPPETSSTGESSSSSSSMGDTSSSSSSSSSSGPDTDTSGDGTMG